MTTEEARRRADYRRELVVELVRRCGGQSAAARLLGWPTSRLGGIYRGQRGRGRAKLRDEAGR